MENFREKSLCVDFISSVIKTCLGFHGILCNNMLKSINYYPDYFSQKQLFFLLDYQSLENQVKRHVIKQRQ